MSEPKQFAVLGGGSFGTILANILAGNGHATTLWMRDAERATRAQSNRENPEYLPGYHLHAPLTASADLATAVQADVVFISVPSSSFRAVTRQAAPHLRPGTLLVSTTKGIEADSFKLMSQILEEETEGMRIGVLSGPNLAKEIADHHFTGSVIASEDAELCAILQQALSCDYFRVYDNSDRFGVELGGALKNIYAIVTGMATALGSGHNTQAMLITRALAEMGRFAAQLGANPLTFLGLAGVGDLIVTCSSPLSRNYRLGQAVAQGKSLDEAQAEIGQVVEGVNTVRLVKHKAEEMGVYMPLATGLYEVLFGQRTIAEVVKSLMLGEHNHDVEYLAR